MFILQFMIRKRKNIYLRFLFSSISSYQISSTHVDSCTCVLVKIVLTNMSHIFKRNAVRTKFYNFITWANIKMSKATSRCLAGDIIVWHDFRMTPGSDSANLFFYLFRVSDFSSFPDWLMSLAVSASFFIHFASVSRKFVCKLKQ